MKTFIFSLLAILALTLSACSPATSTPAPTSTPAHVDVIEEDDPRWDCETMGNKICGPIAAH